MQTKHFAASAAFAAALIAAFTFVSCASRPKTSAQANAAAAKEAANAEVPDFVANPPQSDTLLYGIGSAKADSTQLSITMAEARARQSIAVQLETTVKACIQDYAQQSGVTGNTRAMEFAEAVGRQIVNVKLDGAKVVKRQKMNDGTWWILTQYDKTAAASDAAKAVSAQAADYAEFKNWKAQQAMDKYLAQDKTAPQPVTK